MPYKDKQKQLDYQNKWMKKRREDWLAENGPCVLCRSSTDLQVDHINPKDKVDHRVWSWSLIRIKEELSKCQVLCWDCHKEKTRGDVEAKHGTNSRYTSPIWKCRCDLCKDAHLQADRKWKLEQKNKPK